MYWKTVSPESDIMGQRNYVCHISFFIILKNLYNHLEILYKKSFGLLNIKYLQQY
uniref:Uncharacterized protein n=1 Tax=Lepeophtheirus salmonis TaxID=72036 RepID=A0A0K2TRB9_LEPSM